MTMKTKKDEKVKKDRTALFESEAQKYIENCKRLEIRIDPSVVISLKTGWNILKPSTHFKEGEMLPLMDILNKNDYVTEIDISLQNSNGCNGDSNARVLNKVLQRNSTLSSLNVSSTGLGDDGLKELCEGLSQNNSLVELDLSRNNFTHIGANYLTEALSVNKSLKKIDLSNNALGFVSINSVLCICGPKNLSVGTSGNYVFEEILNSVSHGVAFIFSILGANLLVTECLDVYKTDFHFWACVLYSFSMMFLFLSSCLFHSFFMAPTTSRVLQVLDHVGIYLLIAGSFTPICLITLNHYNNALVLIAAEWIAALLGSIFAMCSDLNHPSTTVVELCFFVGMGLGGFIFLYEPIVATFTSKMATLLGLTGFFYLFGITFFILGEYRPIYHVIWHMCVFFAAAFHWFNIFFYVVQTDIHGWSPTKVAVEDMVQSVSHVSADLAAITLADIAAYATATASEAANIATNVYFNATASA